MPETNNVGPDNQPRYNVPLADSITLTAAPARLAYTGGTAGDVDQGVGILDIQADADNTDDVIIGGYSSPAALAAMTTAQGVRLAKGQWLPRMLITRLDSFQARSVSGTQTIRYFAQK